MCSQLSLTIVSHEYWRETVLDQGKQRYSVENNLLSVISQGSFGADSEKVWPELCLALGITTPKWFTNKKNTCHNDSWKGNVYNVFFFLQWKTKVGHMIHNHQSTCSSTVNPCEKGQDYLKQCHDQDQCKVFFFFLTLFLNIHQLPNYFYRKHSIQMKVKNNNT